MLEHVIIIAMLCQGIHCVTRRGMILGFVEDYLYDACGNLKSVLFKPLFECTCCMVSYWGLLYMQAMELYGGRYGVFFFSIILLSLIERFFSKKIMEGLYFLIFGLVVLCSNSPINVSFCILAAGGVNYFISSVSE